MHKINLLLLFSFFITQAYCQGCYFSTQANFEGTPTNYSGNTYLDQFLTGEYYKLVQCFGVKPNSYFINEKQPNAYATPNVSNASYPDGTVVLGLKLTYKECTSSYSGTCVAMAVIMAHEFAHILDYKNNFIQGQGKTKELFADYMAGVYLHTRALTYSYTDIQEAAQSIFAKGDTEFNSPNHHGTSLERMNALLAGYNYSLTRFNSGIYSISVAEAMYSAKKYLHF